MCTSDFRCLLQWINSCFVQNRSLRTAHCSTSAYPLKQMHHSTSEQCHLFMDLDIPEYSLTLSSHLNYIYTVLIHLVGLKDFSTANSGYPASWSKRARMSLSLEALLFASQGSCSSGIPPTHTHTHGWVYLTQTAYTTKSILFQETHIQLFLINPKLPCCLTFF